MVSRKEKRNAQFARIKAKTQKASQDDAKKHGGFGRRVDAQDDDPKDGPMARGKKTRKGIWD